MFEDFKKNTGLSPDDVLSHGVKLNSYLNESDKDSNHDGQYDVVGGEDAELEPDEEAQYSPEGETSEATESNEIGSHLDQYLGEDFTEKYEDDAPEDVDESRTRMDFSSGAPKKKRTKRQSAGERAKGRRNYRKNKRKIKKQRKRRKRKPANKRRKKRRDRHNKRNESHENVDVLEHVNGVLGESAEDDRSYQDDTRPRSSITRVKPIDKSVEDLRHSYRLVRRISGAVEDEELAESLDVFVEYCRDMVEEASEGYLSEQELEVASNEALAIAVQTASSI